MGPASIEVMNFDGRVITRAKGDSADGDDVLADDWDSSQSTLEDAFAGDLYQRTEFAYSHGQRTESIEWTDARRPQFHPV